MFNSFVACGLAFDVVGIVLLGAAFFFKTKKSIRQEAGTYWDANPYLLKSIIASKFDGMAGTLYLFVGFTFQFLGASEFHNEKFVFWAYIVGLVALMFYLYFARKMAVNSWYKKLKTAGGED